jgi:hypothetical protein
MMTTRGIGDNSGDARPFNENSAPKRADTKPTRDTAKPITSIRQGDIKPTSQSDDELAASAQRHFAVADQYKYKRREELYLAVGYLYWIYENNYPNRRKREEFKRTMSREELPMKRFSLAIFVVRHFGKITNKGTVSRYAIVLRKAHSDNVQPENIVGYIKNRMDKLSRSKIYQRRHENRDDKAADAKQSTKRLRNHDKTKRTHRRRQTASSKPRVTLILEKDTEQKFHNASAESTFWIRARKTDNHTARAREVRPNFPGTSMKRSENKRAHH